MSFPMGIPECSLFPAKQHISRKECKKGTGKKVANKAGQQQRKETLKKGNKRKDRNKESTEK